MEKAKYPQNAHGNISVRVEMMARDMFGLSQTEVKETIFCADRITREGTLFEALLNMIRAKVGVDERCNVFIEEGKEYLGKCYTDIPEEKVKQLLFMAEMLIATNDKK